MSDLIDRQAVLDAIHEAYMNAYDEKSLVRDLTQAINELPSVKPQEPKWIPVSERLPNKGQWVLVTKEERQKPIEIMCYQGIRIGEHNIGNGWEEYEYPSWTSGHGDIRGSHPKAWMPLPKPYESQERSE